MAVAQAAVLINSACFSLLHTEYRCSTGEHLPCGGALQRPGELGKLCQRRITARPMELSLPASDAGSTLALLRSMHAGTPPVTWNSTDHPARPAPVRARCTYRRGSQCTHTPGQCRCHGCRPVTARSALAKAASRGERRSDTAKSIVVSSAGSTTSYWLNDQPTIGDCKCSFNELSIRFARIVNFLRKQYEKPARKILHRSNGYQKRRRKKLNVPILTAL